MLNKGGFSLKGITVSGSPQPEHLSDDGESVNVGGRDEVVPQRRLFNTEYP